jgi:hypothetical protein
LKSLVFQSGKLCIFAAICENGASDIRVGCFGPGLASLQKRTAKDLPVRNIQLKLFFSYEISGLNQTGTFIAVNYEHPLVRWIFPKIAGSTRFCSKLLLHKR